MRKRAFFLDRRWGKRRWALLASVSVLALLAADRVPPAFAGSPPLSPAALTQAAGVHQAQVAAAIAGSLANPMTQKQIQLSTANLTRAAQAFQAMQAAQAAATAASQLTLNNVPLSGSSWDGSTLSGLKPVNDHDPTLWINANPIDPTADINTATATETIHQTAANSLLTWQSFDLNKGETLVFDQQGHADWTVLNRIVAGRDPITGARTVATPSYILGSIQAPGSVYVINPNGIIFGATSQVNVHSLIASTLDVGNPTMTLAERNGFFLNNGISNANIACRQLLLQSGRYRARSCPYGGRERQSGPDDGPGWQPRRSLGAGRRSDHHELGAPNGLARCRRLCLSLRTLRSKRRRHRDAFGRDHDGGIANRATGSECLSRCKHPTHIAAIDIADIPRGRIQFDGYFRHGHT